MKSFINVEVIKEGKTTISMFVFYLVLVAQCISYIGSGIMCFGQAVWIYTDLGGTITNLALLTIVGHLPGMLLSPLAGVIADRCDRRIIMLVCNSVAALATLLLRVLIVSHTFALWQIYIITAIVGIVNRFQWPAYVATIPQIVPPRHLARANGLVSIAQSIGFITAPIFAGFIVTVFTIQGIILFDLTSFLVAFFTLLFVRFPKVNSEKIVKTKIRIIEDLKSGFAYLKQKSGILELMLIMAVTELAAGMVGTLYLPMILGVTSSNIGGIILSVGGITSIAGGLYVSLWGGPKKKIMGILIFILIAGISLLIGGVHPLIPLFVISLILFSFCPPLYQTSNNILIQKKVENHFLGRALAIQAMIYSLAMHLGLLIAGPVADYLFEPALMENGALAKTIGVLIGIGKGRGIALLFIVLGLMLVIVSIIGFLNKKVRYIEINNEDYIDEEADTILAGTNLSSDNEIKNFEKVSIQN